MVSFPISTIEEKTTQSGDEHIEFLKFVLSLLNLYVPNITLLIDENCSTNESIVTKLGTPLFGLSIYFFKLSVREMISMEQKAFRTVNTLMFKFHTPLLQAELHQVIAQFVKLFSKAR